MEHPCDQCSSPVEDGTAFCPHCGAAQIRVASDEAGRTGGPTELLTASGAAASTLIQWSQALPAAALAGLVAAGLMLIPSEAFGLSLCMISAGFLAVLFYRRRSPGAALSPGMGARLGMVGGVLGFAMSAVFTAVEILVFHSGSQLRTALLERIEQSALRTPDPQAQQFVTYLKSPPGLALVLALGLVGMFLVFLIFSALGGALAAALQPRKGRV